MNIKREIKEAFFENKNIFITLLIIFIAGFILGCILADDIAPVLMPMIKETMEAEGLSSISAFNIIFHNESTAILVFFGSIIFGICAIISMFVNGFIIGFTAGYMIKSANTLIIYSALIVPHGIFEIPALFCSGTAGILLFLFIFRVIKDMINKNTFSLSYENNKKNLKHAIILILIAVVLFLIAGLIEGFITPHIGNIISLQLGGPNLLN